MVFSISDFSFPNSLRKQKAVSKSLKQSLRRADNSYPRYHSNCADCYIDTPSDSNKPYALTQQSREGSNNSKNAGIHPNAQLSVLPSDSGATANCLSLMTRTNRHLSQKALAAALSFKVFEYFDLN